MFHGDETKQKQNVVSAKLNLFESLALKAILPL